MSKTDAASAAAEPQPQDQNIDAPVTEESKTEDELWAEFDAAENAAASTDDLDAPAGDEPTGTEADPDKQVAAAADDDGPADDHDDEKEEPKAGSGDEPADQQAAGDDDAKGSEDTDPWANAPPELKAAHEAAEKELQELRHFKNSEHGRQNALKRRIDELQAELEKAAKPQAAEGDEENLDEEIKALQEEYPDVAKPLLKKLARLEAQLTDQGKAVSRINEDRQTSTLLENEDVLAEQHPDWKDVTAEETFPDWLNEQPRYVQEAVARNAEGIVDAQEAADVIGRYKASPLRTTQQTATDQGQQQQPKKGNGGTPSTELSGKRQRQLESSTAARSTGRGAPASTEIPEDGDPDEIWKAFDKKEAREAAAARRA